MSLVDRSFTWVRANGNAMSKFDRIMVSLDWLHRWPNATQYGLDRSISDHCPIMLKHNSLNWGPRPFRLYNCWMKELGFVELVKKKYSSFVVHGLGGGGRLHLQGKPQNVKNGDQELG